MHPLSLQNAPKRFRCSRSGKALLRVLIGLVVFVVLGIVTWQVLVHINWTSEEARPTMYVVHHGEFLNEITERGEIESASNVEVRCEVKARGRGGATILWVIPEGTNVKPEQKLIEFDASALEADLNQQEITCKNVEADLARADNGLNNAKDALKEYNMGTYPLEEMAIKIKMFTAKENQRQAEQKLAYTKELARKGYVPDLRVERDQFAFDKAEIDYKSAETEMMVLKDFKKPKMLSLLNADITTAEANLESTKARLDLVKEELKLIQEQIKKCVVYASESGEVVYANETNRHGGQEIIIEAGATVREQQTVLRLPDPNRMQVKAKINESKVTAVETGQPVRITLGAMRDVSLQGVVEKVDEYPAPAAWWAGTVKQYQTYVSVQNTEGVPLKTGLTAEIRIEVERIPDCIQVPVQAVFEHGKKHYCVMEDPTGEKKWVAREVQIGSTNDKFIVITSGLKEGDQVVLGAFLYHDKLDLPELSTELVPSSKRRTTGDKKDVFKQWDKNQDGKLTKDEVPGPMAAGFDKLDANHDGAIDRSELAKLRAMMSRPGNSQGGPAGSRRPGGRRGSQGGSHE